MKISPNALLMIIIMAFILLGYFWPVLKDQYLDYKLSHYEDVVHLTPQNIVSSTIAFNSLDKVNVTLQLNNAVTNQLHTIADRGHHGSIALLFQDDQIGEINLTPDFNYGAITLAMSPGRAGKLHYAIGH